MFQFRFACNIKQCRKTLLKSAYVTKCSHIFCNAHGLEITTSEELICPVCGYHFQTIQDVIRVNLEPDEATKSVMVAGLRPELIMDIAMSAIAFWGYQVNEENLYLEAGLKTANENITVLEKYCENSQAKYKSEINTLERKIQSLNEELEMAKNRRQNLIQQLEEKTKLIHKFQLNNTMSATGIFISKQEQSPSFNIIANGTQNNNFNFKPKPTVTHTPRSMPSFYRRDIDAENDFNFQPNV